MAVWSWWLEKLKTILHSAIMIKLGSYLIYVYLIINSI